MGGTCATTRRRGQYGQRHNPGCTASAHGDYYAYRRGCRCPEAREEWRIYNKRRREGRGPVRRVSRIGTARRLQALAAIGWRWQDIRDARGVGTWQAVQNIAIRERGRQVDVATANEIAALYDRMSGTPGPSERTRRRSAAKGWVPPLAWDDCTIDDPAAAPNLGAPTGDAEDIDDVLVARVLAGRAPFDTLNRAEQVELWRTWERRRRTAGYERSGMVEFQNRYGLKKDQAAGLKLAAAGLNTRGNPIQQAKAVAA